MRYNKEFERVTMDIIEYTKGTKYRKDILKSMGIFKKEIEGLTELEKDEIVLKGVIEPIEKKYKTISIKDIEITKEQVIFNYGVYIEKYNIIEVETAKNDLQRVIINYCILHRIGYIEAIKKLIKKDERFNILLGLNGRLKRSERKEKIKKMISIVGDI